MIHGSRRARPRAALATLQGARCRRLFAALAAALSLAAAGCKSNGPNLCAADQTCAPGFSCDPTTGRCGCESDSSCAEGESCNAAGFCQPKLRCDSSADCEKGSYCDSQSGACIPAGTCTQDLQCPAGQVCAQFSCVTGCRQTGDCHLAEVCRACAAGTPAAQCPVGKQCLKGRCDLQSSCRYGELCLPPPGADPSTDCAADTASCTCVKDTRGPFCGGCSSAPSTPTLCRSVDDSSYQAESYCLIDSTKPLGQAFFCGVNCAEGQECPNGYACRDVRIVTAQTCKFSDALSACKPPPGKVPVPSPCDPAKTHAVSGKPGLVNDDCLAVQPPLVGAVCDPMSRVCSAQCLGTGETSSYGFCSCLQDSDCPQDHCSASTHTCSVSGKPCQLNVSPDECQTTHQIRCVKALDSRLGDVGYCRIGRNCAPAPGYTCEVLRSGGP